MDTTQTGTVLTRASLPPGGLVCVLVAVNLLLGAVGWLAAFALMQSLTEFAVPGMAYVAGVGQIVVAILFAVCGMLYIRRSRHAKVFLATAVASLIIEPSLLILTFMRFVALNS